MKEFSSLKVKKTFQSTFLFKAYSVLIMHNPLPLSAFFLIYMIEITQIILELFDYSTPELTTSSTQSSINQGSLIISTIRKYVTMHVLVDLNIVSINFLIFNFVITVISLIVYYLFIIALNYINLLTDEKRSKDINLILSIGSLIIYTSAKILVFPCLYVIFTFIDLGVSQNLFQSSIFQTGIFVLSIICLIFYLALWIISLILFNTIDIFNRKILLVNFYYEKDLILLLLKFILVFTRFYYYSVLYRIGLSSVLLVLVFYLRYKDYYNTSILTKLLIFIGDISMLIISVILLIFETFPGKSLDFYVVIVIFSLIFTLLTKLELHKANYNDYFLDKTFVSEMLFCRHILIIISMIKELPDETKTLNDINFFGYISHHNKNCKNKEECSSSLLLELASRFRVNLSNETEDSGEQEFITKIDLNLYRNVENKVTSEILTETKKLKIESLIYRVILCEIKSAYKRIAQISILPFIEASIHLYVYKNIYYSLFGILKFVNTEQNISFRVRFLYYRLYNEIQSQIYSSSASNLSNTSAITNMLKFYGFNEDFHKTVATLLLSSEDYFSQVLLMRPKPNEIQKASYEIGREITQLHLLYSSLSKINPNEISMIRIYLFLIETLFDLKTYCKKIRGILRQNIKAMLNNDRFQNIDNFSGLDKKSVTIKKFCENSDAGIIIVSGLITSLGQIRYLNRNAATLIGYDAEDLQNTSINIIIPEPIASLHNQIMLEFYKTGKFITLDNLSTMLVVNKTNILISISSFITIIPDLSLGLMFVAMIKSSRNFKIVSSMKLHNSKFLKSDSTPQITEVVNSKVTAKNSKKLMKRKESLNIRNNTHKLSSKRSSSKMTIVINKMMTSYTNNQLAASRIVKDKLEINSEDNAVIVLNSRYFILHLNKNAASLLGMSNAARKKFTKNITYYFRDFKKRLDLLLRGEQVELHLNNQNIETFRNKSNAMSNSILNYEDLPESANESILNTSSNVGARKSIIKARLDDTVLSASLWQNSYFYTQTLSYVFIVYTENTSRFKKIKQVQEDLTSKFYNYIIGVIKNNPGSISYVKAPSNIDQEEFSIQVNPIKDNNEPVEDPPNSNNNAKEEQSLKVEDLKENLFCQKYNKFTKFQVYLFYVSIFLLISIITFAHFFVKSYLVSLENLEVLHSLIFKFERNIQQNLVFMFFITQAKVMPFSNTNQFTFHFNKYIQKNFDFINKLNSDLNSHVIDSESEELISFFTNPQFEVTSNDSYCSKQVTKLNFHYAIEKLIFYIKKILSNDHKKINLANLFQVNCNAPLPFDSRTTISELQLSYLFIIDNYFTSYSLIFDTSFNFLNDYFQQSITTYYSAIYTFYGVLVVIVLFMLPIKLNVIRKQEVEFGKYIDYLYNVEEDQMSFAIRSISIFKYSYSNYLSTDQNMQYTKDLSDSNLKFEYLLANTSFFLKFYDDPDMLKYQEMQKIRETKSNLSLRWKNKRNNFSIQADKLGLRIGSIAVSSNKIIETKSMLGLEISPPQSANKIKPSTRRSSILRNKRISLISDSKLLNRVEATTPLIDKHSRNNKLSDSRIQLSVNGDNKVIIQGEPQFKIPKIERSRKVHQEKKCSRLAVRIIIIALILTIYFDVSLYLLSVEHNRVNQTGNLSALILKREIIHLNVALGYPILTLTAFKNPNTFDSGVFYNHLIAQDSFEINLHSKLKAFIDSLPEFTFLVQVLDSPDIGQICIDQGLNKLFNCQANKSFTYLLLEPSSYINYKHTNCGQQFANKTLNAKDTLTKCINDPIITNYFISSIFLSDITFKSVYTTYSQDREGMHNTIVENFDLLYAFLIVGYLFLLIVTAGLYFPKVTDNVNKYLLVLLFFRDTKSKALLQS